MLLKGGDQRIAFGSPVAAAQVIEVCAA